MDRPWVWAGDRAILRRFGGALESANARALTLARHIEALDLPEVADSIPGARTVLVVLRDDVPSAALLEAVESDIAPEDVPASRAHWIDVRYDGVDLEAVAAMTSLSADEVIAAHTSTEYIVALTGFVPGFAYLRGLPPALKVPRLETPRTRVPAGSVAIAGGYTGIYPTATAGGWRLIGSTDVSLFDERRDEPVLLRPGDTVRFRPR